jgi:hypothetical protein
MNNVHLRPADSFDEPDYDLLVLETDPTPPARSATPAPHVARSAPRRSLELTFSDADEAFFAAGEALAELDHAPDGEYADEAPRLARPLAGFRLGFER